MNNHNKLLQAIRITKDKNGIRNYLHVVLANIVTLKFTTDHYKITLIRFFISMMEQLDETEQTEDFGKYGDEEMTDHILYIGALFLDKKRKLHIDAIGTNYIYSVLLVCFSTPKTLKIKY